MFGTSTPEKREGNIFSGKFDPIVDAIMH